MIEHVVRPRRSAENLPREEQLAWKLARLAAERPPVDEDVAQMVANRLVDDAAVAVAALGRRPVANARAQALCHPMAPGAALFGLGDRHWCSPEWAAWANGVAVRELDYHDTFLGAEYSHPGDNIPPLLAVAQHCGRSGADLLAAIVTAYEVQVDLSRAICLHKHKIDHVAHLGPSVAAGLGTLLGLSAEITYQAIGQALHTTTATRQSRKGAISSWKAYAPAFAAKAAVEAVDRAMRGETSPAPIYEGEDGVIAWLLDGPEARYRVALPGPDEPRRAIMQTYTKEHSAEYQAQAFIDLARRLREKLGDLSRVASVRIETSHHTHFVIGTGSGDPQKFDPNASRETLDHSLPYIFAVALEDGGWDHEASYAPERARRASTVALWRKISTDESPQWTARYDAQEAFGGRVVVVLEDGTTVEDAIDLPDAHPGGARPFGADDYKRKFTRLATGVVAEEDQERFLGLAYRLGALSPAEVRQCNVTALGPAGRAEDMVAGGLEKGLF